MYTEFIEIAGYEVSFVDYSEIIEPMYNATSLDKWSFVKCIDRKRFEVKREMSEEEKELINSLKEGIKMLKEDNEYWKSRLDSYKELATACPEDDFSAPIKSYKETIRRNNQRIKEIRFVLSK